MATLKDLAKETGLAVGTVSRVLNNRGYISTDARNKVNNALKKLNYRPNETTQSLYIKSSGTIGLVVPCIRHPYFSAVISSLENEASKRGYNILLCSTGDSGEKRQEYHDMCRKHRVVGMILCGGSVPGEMLHQTDLPIITMGCFLEDGTASIECDHVHGGELAAKKLISCGCHHLLHLGTAGEMSILSGKHSEGFRKVCERENTPMVERMIEEALCYDLNCHEQIEQVLLQYPETDGVFAGSDIIAAQTLQVCRKLGISVPGQMKVIGFDNVLLSTLTTPQLTTVHQPVNEMAEFALNLLQDALAGRLVLKRAVLPVRLIERGSTGEVYERL